MRLILSRKGFDSACGGVPSPIWPDGTMLSLPIPHPQAALRFGDVACRGRALSDIIAPLTRGRIGAGDRVHLDPDLRPGARPRQPGWRPAFGQLGAAQAHLAAQGVGPGDLFLFFGWFRRVDDAAGPRFQRGAPDQHVIFGWLQVGEVLAVGSDLAAHRALRPWLAEHPHLQAHGVPGNTVYLAADRLVLDGRNMGVAGGGTFGRFAEPLRLSSCGMSRSLWRLPGWMHPSRSVRLSYHADERRWAQADDAALVRSAAQGQEFVAAVDPARVADWVATMLAATVDAALQRD